MHIFHSLDKWKDINVFSFGTSYLLQGRKCKECNATFFRIKSASNIFVDNRQLTEEVLKTAGLWENDKEQK